MTSLSYRSVHFIASIFMMGAISTTGELPQKTRRKLLNSSHVMWQDIVPFLLTHSISMSVRLPISQINPILRWVSYCVLHLNWYTSAHNEASIRMFHATSAIHS